MQVIVAWTDLVDHFTPLLSHIEKLVNHCSSPAPPSPTELQHGRPQLSLGEGELSRMCVDGIERGVSGFAKANVRVRVIK